MTSEVWHIFMSWFAKIIFGEVFKSFAYFFNSIVWFFITEVLRIPYVLWISVIVIYKYFVSW